jgi:glycine/D-amino acid oxidase-like deaminating enzyme
VNDAVNLHHREPPTSSLLLPAVRDLDAPLPSETDVLIIGGGLAGCAIAYYLAKAGVAVTLVERGELNREASGTNAGSFHFQIAIHQLTGTNSEADQLRLLNDVRLQAAAAAMWSELEVELGTDLGVHVTGGLMVAETPSEVQILFDKQKIEQRAGLETEVLTGDALRDFAPYLSERIIGATYCAKEGHANPLLSAPAFAARALEAGARFKTHAKVLSVESVDGNSTTRFRVQTSAGMISAYRVVNAAGAWADSIAGLSGLSLPMRHEGLHVNVSEPRERMLTPMLQHIGRRLTLKQASNGTFIIGGGWPARDEPDPKRYSVRWSSAAGNAAVALSVLPSLKDLRITHMWTGVIAFTDDLNPILGEFRSLPGYFVCVASTGFTLGPLVARQLARFLVEPGSSELPPEFAPDRIIKSPTPT